MLVFYAPLTPDICVRIAFILDLVTPSKAELFPRETCSIIVLQEAS